MTQILKIPAIGEGDQEATVIAVLVAQGASVAAGDPILEIETDKATMEVPAEGAGTITSLLVKAGDKVVSGTDYAHLAAVKNDAGEIECRPVADKPIETVAPVAPSLAPSDPTPSDTPTKPFDGTVIPAGPGTRRLARELGVDLSKVPGSDRKGRINQQDVKAYVKQLNRSHIEGDGYSAMRALPDFSAFGATTRKALSSIGTATSRNMVNAWSRIPHAWLQEKIDITALEAWRQANKEEVKRQGGALTMTILLAKALAVALKGYPVFNSSFDENSNEVVFREYQDISIAVDTEQGLLVPVLRAVNQKGLLELSRDLLALSEKARTRKLAPTDMQGGGITLSNLGGIGLTAIFPIVNWPQVAIVGVAASEPTLCLREGKVETRRLLTVTLGFDHRVINGADGARFLGCFKKLLEDPRLMLL